MLFALSNLLRDKETTLSAMYSEPNNTIDVAIVGSSHVNNGYIPNILWENNNLSACNVYSWSQPMWTSYHYIKETLKTQSPEIIVLEMYGMMYGHSYIQPQEIDKTNYANSFNIDLGLNYLQLIKTAEQVGIELRPYENFLNLPRYHTRWKTLNSKMLTYNPHKDRDFLKGYGLTFASDSNLQNPNIKTDVVYQPYEFSVEYLEKIVQLCEKENIQLIFTMTPYVYSEREVEIYNWIDIYSKEHNIPFLNYNGDDGQRIGVDFSTDLSNMGHSNYFGAVKITEDLSRLLKEYSNKQKMDNKAYEMLNQDYEKYQRVILANDIMTVETLNEYIALALKDENYTLFIINSGVDIENSFFDILQEYKITLPKDKSKFTLAINVDGNNLLDKENIDFKLFSKQGNVKFNFAPDQAEIYLNNQPVFSQASDFKIVLYDNKLERPLETVALVGQTLKHKEFTSDIINIFKK